MKRRSPWFWYLAVFVPLWIAGISISVAIAVNGGQLTLLGITLTN